jgi:hypothetical protein
MEAAKWRPVQNMEQVLTQLYHQETDQGVNKTTVLGFIKAGDKDYENWEAINFKKEVFHPASQTKNDKGVVISTTPAHYTYDWDREALKSAGLLVPKDSPKADQDAGDFWYFGDLNGELPQAGRRSSSIKTNHAIGQGVKAIGKSLGLGGE